MASAANLEGRALPPTYCDPATHSASFPRGHPASRCLSISHTQACLLQSIILSRAPLAVRKGHPCPKPSPALTLSSTIGLLIRKPRPLSLAYQPSCATRYTNTTSITSHPQPIASPPFSPAAASTTKHIPLPLQPQPS